MTSKTKENFIHDYNQGKGQLIYSKIIADTETPITASLKLMQDKEPFFLLESVEKAGNIGRYSIIGFKPDLIFKCDKDKAEISYNGQPFITQKTDSISALRKLYKETKLDIPDELPPMASGLIGYLSYDAIRYIEKTIPDNNKDNINIPIGMFMRPTIMVIFDSVTSSIFITRTTHPQKDLSALDAYNQAHNDIENIKNKLSTNINQHGDKEKQLIASKQKLDFKPHVTKEHYLNLVNKAKEYIYAGDIFQIVPSQRFSSEFNLPAFALYRSLRNLNPSPFLFFLNFGDFQLVGSSPEILARLRDNKVTIRPLAGTRKRGKNKAEDETLAKDLLSDEKEISEHLMLIDLSRNDVGKVCKAGSVKVTEQMIIEYYSHVMHISSNVEGEIDPKYDALDALFAALPVGTVSGAPKVRAMQIIDELEQEKRSFYAGCVGYFSANGTMDTCITLRTGLVKDHKLYLQAGGGIVAGSDPESEYQETLNKAKALMRAAENAHEFV